MLDLRGVIPQKRSMKTPLKWRESGSMLSVIAESGVRGMSENL